MKIAYDAQRIYHNGVEMRTLLFIGQTSDFVNDIWFKPELPNPLRNAGSITECVNKQDATLGERRHLGQRDLQRAMADLGRDGKVESTAFGHFTLDPHIALHEVDESLGDGKS